MRSQVIGMLAILWVATCPTTSWSIDPEQDLVVLDAGKVADADNPVTTAGRLAQAPVAGTQPARNQPVGPAQPAVSGVRPNPSVPASGPASPSAAPLPSGSPAVSQPAGPLAPVPSANESARAELNNLLADELGSSALSAQPGTFGSLGGITSGGFPQMIGDLGPLPALAISKQGTGHFPAPFPPPTPPAVPKTHRTATVVPSIRGIKISEDQSPIPQDRIYSTFNYFQGVNDQVNSRLQSPIGYSQVFRYIMGGEKTFLDGQGSVGMRLPIDTVTTSNALGRSAGNFAGTSTAVGDLSVYFKYILLQNREKGDLLSGGLAVTAPTGPGRFAGFPNFGPSPHPTTLQPFLGYLINVKSLYFQGFSIIDVPTTSQDVTLWYNDVGLGYFILRPDPNSTADPLISLIAPTFEVHVNTPLNHRDVFNARDPVGSADIVNLTYGLNIGIYRRTLLTFAMVSPVSSPKPFDFESMVFLNVFFGGSVRRVPITPPAIGGG